MVDLLNRSAVAAITLDERGGGIAAVSRLVHRVLSESAGRVACPVITLTPGATAASPSTATRLRFGVRILLAQARREFDWLFYMHLGLAQAQRAVPSVLARPYAVFLHDIEAWDPLAPARERVLRRAFLRVANSHYTAARVMAAHPAAGPVVACQLALPAAAPTVRKTPAVALRDRAPHVVIVGRIMSMERYKGHDQLLDVWPRVIAVVPDARLICVGDGDDVDRLRLKAIALGVGQHVEFPGFLPEPALRAIYDRAALFAMPSRREGFGLVYLEAMAAGLPCIGSIHDAAVEIIEDGVTGFLVDQGDGAALEDRLLRLLIDPARREQLGRNGQRRFEEHFTYEIFATRLRDLVRAAREAAISCAR